MNTFNKLVASVVTLTTLTTFVAGPALANERSARRNALDGMAALGAAGYDIVVGVDGGLLPRGGTAIRYVELRAGRPYVVGAGGCDDAFDVDVAIIDPLGRVVAADTTSNTEAAVRVDPRMDGTYTVVVKLADSTFDGAHWVLLVHTPSSVASR